MEAAESIGVETEEWALAHEALSKLCLKRAELDAEEGKWMLRAFRAATHVYFGYASFGEYIERLFGLNRRTTEEKLRVAKALEELPELERALRSGELKWSAVREVSRVAVPDTEHAWISASRSKTAREVERLVSGRAPGDGPADRRRSEFVRHVLRFEVGSETLATFREAMVSVQKGSEHRLDDDSALLSMARQILGGPREAGRASYQLVVTQCEDCGRGFQYANGQLIELDPAIVEMCHCDAQEIPTHLRGSAAVATTDGPVGNAADESEPISTHTGNASTIAQTGALVDNNAGAVAQTHVDGVAAITQTRAHVGNNAGAVAQTHVDGVAAITQTRAHVGNNAGAVAQTHVDGVAAITQTRAHVGNNAGAVAQSGAQVGAHGGDANDGARVSAHVANGRNGAKAGSHERPKRPGATQDTPPSIRRQVFLRDRGRCVVPGCRNATYLDLHHLELRSEGGSNDPENLVVLCGAHHGASHRGRLRIDGKAFDRPPHSPRRRHALRLRAVPKSRRSQCQDLRRPQKPRFPRKDRAHSPRTSPRHLTRQRIKRSPLTRCPVPRRALLTHTTQTTQTTQRQGARIPFYTRGPADRAQKRCAARAWARAPSTTRSRPRGAADPARGRWEGPAPHHNLIGHPLGELTFRSTRRITQSAEPIPHLSASPYSANSHLSWLNGAGRCTTRREQGRRRRAAPAAPTASSRAGGADGVEPPREQRPR